jgi:hypothetical protein
MCKKTKVYLVLLAFTVALIFALTSLRDCRESVVIPPQDQAQPLPPHHYTAPVVNVPFITPKPPVKQANLPIPAKQVEETIVVKTPESAPVTIVIDKKGNVYPTKDTPPGTTIEVTKWHPPLIQICHRFSVSALYAGGPLFSLGYDPIRIWKVYLGVDIGKRFTDNKWLIGTSVRYQLIKSNRLDITAVVGKNWMDSKLYVGVNVGW